MKKFTIAAIMAVASVAATAQVSLTGKVSQWMDNTTVGTSRVQGMTMEPTSNFAIGVKEDLGGGLSARATLETSLNGNSISGGGTQIGDRQSTVGVAGRAGSIDLGRNVHSQFLAVTSNDAFGTLYGSVAGDVHNLRGLRFSNGSFVTVNPMKGVTAAWDRSNNTPGNADQTAYSLGAKVGPLNAVVARFQQGAAETSDVIGANATFGATTLFYSHSDNKSAVAGETKKGDLVGVAQKMGAITAKASYGKTNTNVTAYNLGADYALGKRTTVGVAYRNVDATGSANDVKQLGVGLTLLF